MSTPTSDAVILRLYSTTSTLRLVEDLTRAYVQNTPQISFDLFTGSYDTLVRRIAGDEQAYFVTSHLPEPGETPLWGAPIGQDGIAIITHPDNPVRNLSTAQLRGIYQGTIKSWDAVGGTENDIVVYSREEGSGTRAELEHLVMGRRLTNQAAIIAPSSAAMLVSIARDRHGIGYVSMSYLDSSVRALSINDTALTTESVYDHTYPLRSTLFIAGAAEPTREAYRSFIAWVQSPDGQQIVARYHAPFLRPER